MCTLDYANKAHQCKNKHDTAVCHEKLKFDKVMEKAMKSKTGGRANYYRSCDPGGILCFSPIVWQ